MGVSTSRRLDFLPKVLHKPVPTALQYAWRWKVPGRRLEESRCCGKVSQLWTVHLNPWRLPSTHSVTMSSHTPVAREKSPHTCVESLHGGRHRPTLHSTPIRILALARRHLRLSVRRSVERLGPEHEGAVISTGYRLLERAQRKRKCRPAQVLAASVGAANVPQFADDEPGGVPAPVAVRAHDVTGGLVHGVPGRMRMISATRQAHEESEAKQRAGGSQPCPREADVCSVDGSSSVILSRENTRIVWDTNGTYLASSWLSSGRERRRGGLRDSDGLGVPLISSFRYASDLAALATSSCPDLVLDWEGVRRLSTLWIYQSRLLGSLVPQELRRTRCMREEALEASWETAWAIAKQAARTIRRHMLCRIHSR